MIYVLGLFLLICIWIFLKSVKKKGCIKKNLKVVLCKNQSTLNAKLYLKKLLIFNVDCLQLLDEYTPKIVCKVDEILSKVRLNHFVKPNQKVDLLALKKIGITNFPIYVAKKSYDSFELNSILIAKKIESFEAVVFCYDKDKEGVLFDSNFLLFDRFIKKSLKKWILSLDVNHQINNINQKINFADLKNGVNLSCEHIVNNSIKENYFLKEYVTKEILLEEKTFFLGEKITFLNVINKTNAEKVVGFYYVLDLQKGKYNYKIFKTTKNAVKIFSCFGNNKIFNFSASPLKIAFSKCLDLICSNAPIIKLDYLFVLKPNENRQICFSESNKIINLKNLKYDEVAKFSGEYLKNFFNIKLQTEDKHFNTIFNTVLVNCAKFELFKKGFCNIVCYENNLKTLLKKFENKELSALDTYFSVKNMLIEEEGEKLRLKNPNQIEGDFSVFVYFDNQYRKFDVIKKNLSSPCLVLNGVKYVNNALIFKKHLKKKEKIVVEC